MSEPVRQTTEWQRRWRCWGDVFWHYASAGHDYADAAYRADEWEKRRAR